MEETIENKRTEGNSLERKLSVILCRICETQILAEKVMVNYL